MMSTESPLNLHIEPEAAKSRFLEFWNEWPENGVHPFADYGRKKNRAGCEAKWNKSNYNAIADTIIGNVQQRKLYDKEWLKNRGAFLNAPLVYLNQRHWDDGKFSDVRDDRKSLRANSNAPDLNKVCDWIKENKKLTEKQLTSQWFWLSDGTRVVGVRIPDMPDLMFKSFTQATQ